MPLKEKLVAFTKNIGMFTKNIGMFVRSNQTRHILTHIFALKII
jgi:hypothetical protein